MLVQGKRERGNRERERDRERDREREKREKRKREKRERSERKRERAHYGKRNLRCMSALRSGSGISSPTYSLAISKASS